MPLLLYTQERPYKTVQKDISYYHTLSEIIAVHCVLKWCTMRTEAIQSISLDKNEYILTAVCPMNQQHPNPLLPNQMSALSITASYAMQQRCIFSFVKNVYKNIGALFGNILASYDIIYCIVLSYPLYICRKQQPLFYPNMTNITDFPLKDDRGHTQGEESVVKWWLETILWEILSNECIHTQWDVGHFVVC